jgi:hypothetical protein
MANFIEKMDLLLNGMMEAKVGINMESGTGRTALLL